MAFHRDRRKKSRVDEVYLGMVINTAVKPCRDVLLGILECLRLHPQVRLSFFHGNAATSPRNIADFASSGMDALLFCGMRWEIVEEFLREMPDHPPIVANLYAPLSPDSFAQLGRGGTVVLDNVDIGRVAADFFVEHGIKNFAFFGSKVYRECVAGEIRREAFRARIGERLDGRETFASLVEGKQAENEDYWDGDHQEVERFIRSLPKPCGIFANGDREAYRFIDACNHLGIVVPDQMEVIGVNDTENFCEASKPSISSIRPDHARCAHEAVKMLLELVDNPHLPPERRRVTVSGCQIVKRGSTLSGRGYGGIAVRAREHIVRNACNGINVPDVAKHLGVSRRTLEKRFSEAMGQSVALMIREVRLEKVCKLLRTTKMPISEVTLQCGYPLTSNLAHLFTKLYGMSMRKYRNAHQGSDKMPTKSS